MCSLGCFPESMQSIRGSDPHGGYTLSMANCRAGALLKTHLKNLPLHTPLKLQPSRKKHTKKKTHTHTRKKKTKKKRHRGYMLSMAKCLSTRVTSMATMYSATRPLMLLQLLARAWHHCCHPIPHPCASAFVLKISNDSERIRTPAGRAQWISGPSLAARTHCHALVRMHWLATYYFRYWG